MAQAPVQTNVAMKQHYGQWQLELAEFSVEQLQTVDEIIARHRGKRGALIPVLEEVQNVLGYLPRGIQQRVSAGLGLPLSKIYGVVTFYSYFTQVPRGRHIIRVCFGTACYVKGAQRVYDSICKEFGLAHGSCTDDRRFSLEAVRCLGACGLAPVVVIDEDTHGGVSAETICDIVAKYE